MSWLDIYRKEAERLNVQARDTIRELRHQRKLQRERGYRERRAPMDPEKRKQYMLDFVQRQGFPDVAAYQREWRKQHPGKNSEYRRRHRKNNREKYNAQQRAAYHRRKERHGKAELAKQSGSGGPVAQ